jgi:predicted phosphodiesterase
MTPAMRIAVTSDIHIDKNGPDTCARLAEEIRRREADVLVLAGDVATAPDVLLQSFLTLREAVGRVVYVAGNHDVWSHPDLQARGRHAWWRLDALLPALCAEAGVHDLDAGPLVVGDVGFVGTLGWWDLSTRDPTLDAPDRAYREGSFAGLRWMDHVYAHWPAAAARPMLPEAVAEVLRQRLRDQLALCASPRIVAVTHMLPFAAQLHHKAHPGWRFAQAFIGHLGLGDVIEGDPRVELAVAGHTHLPSDHTRGRLRALVSPLGYRREWDGLTDAEAVRRALTVVEF